jgi:hypothetical protein
MLTLSYYFSMFPFGGKSKVSSSFQAPRGKSVSEQDMYCAGREYSGGKVITTPVLLKYAYM